MPEGRRSSPSNRRDTFHTASSGCNSEFLKLLRVPELIFLEYENISIWWRTARGGGVRLPRRSTERGVTFTLKPLFGPALHFYLGPENPGLFCTPRLPGGPRKILGESRRILKKPVLRSQGLRLSRSLSSIKNLLFHEYEFEYLWLLWKLPALGRSGGAARVPGQMGRNMAPFCMGRCAELRRRVIEGRSPAQHLEPQPILPVP